MELDVARFVPHTQEDAARLHTRATLDVRPLENGCVSLDGLVMPRATLNAYLMRLRIVLRLHDTLRAPDTEFDEIWRLADELTGEEARIRTLLASVSPLQTLAEGGGVKRVRPAPSTPTTFCDLPCDVVSLMLCEEVRSGRVAGDEFTFVMRVAQLSRRLRDGVLGNQTLWQSMLAHAFGLEFYQRRRAACVGFQRLVTRVACDDWRSPGRRASGASKWCGCCGLRGLPPLPLPATLVTPDA